MAAIAGFPKGVSEYEMKITTASSGSSWRYDRMAGIGSITPTYGNVDQTTNIANANGQINYLNYQQDEVTTQYGITLYIKGSYTLATLPFTKMKITYYDTFTSSWKTDTYPTSDLQGAPYAVTSGPHAGSTALVWPPYNPAYQGEKIYSFE